MALLQKKNINRALRPKTSRKLLTTALCLGLTYAGPAFSEDTASQPSAITTPVIQADSTAVKTSPQDEPRADANKETPFVSGISLEKSGIQERPYDFAPVAPQVQYTQEAEPDAPADTEEQKQTNPTQDVTATVVPVVEINISESATSDTGNAIDTVDGLDKETKTEKRSKTFGIQHDVLSNGMEVYVIPNQRVPVVTHMVWYKVGAADEDWGKSGIAHYMEHLMFKGSKNVAPGEFSKTIKKLGGRDNAFTSQDYTAYFQSIAKDHLEKAMTMEADRMRGMVLSDEDIAAERNVVIEERRERTDNKPMAHFRERVNAALFINHPYGTPVIGWQHEIQNLNGKDAQAFHKRFYRPDNALLVVSGDITLDELLPLAEKTYGAINPSEPLNKKDWTKVPLIPGTASFTLYDPSVHQPQYMRMYRVPSFKQNKEQSLATQLLEDILAGGSATRLYQALVKEQKVAVGASLYYSSSSRSDASLSISATPSEGTSMKTLESAIEQEILKLIKDGVTDSELSEAKMRLKDQAVYARDSLTGPAMIVGRMIVTGASVDDIEYWPYDIDAITKKQVVEAARSIFSKRKNSNHVTAYIYPEGYKQPANADIDTQEQE